MGLAKPLEDGDSGTARRIPGVDGDLESRSDLLRKWGVPLVYWFRAVIGDVGCGRAGDRDDAIPGEALLSGYVISISAQSWCGALSEMETGASHTGKLIVA